MIRVVLLVVGISQLAVGVLAFFAPGAFYDLVATYPPENHHFLKDIGSWNIALGAIAIYGAGRPAWQVPLLGLLALQYGLHTISHIVDLNDAEEDWQGWFALVTQGLGTIVLTALFLRSGRVRPSGATPPGGRAMKILLAGATGAIGKPLVRQLVAAGHEVTGLTRRAQRAREVDAAGARGVVCDITDRRATLAVASDVAPDVVLDESTALPQHYDARKMWEFYEGMVDLRLRGTPNLIEAAQQTGARIAFQSIAFMYAPGGNGSLRTEDDPPYVKDAPFPWNLALPAILALEQRVVDMDGLVLRYGMFYGPGTHFDGGQIADDVRKRRFPIVGKGTGVFSFIHVDDAATATVAALERGLSGILNVVDDEPVALREWLPLYARVTGSPRPWRVPAWPVRRLAPLAAHWATTMPGASNARARRELDWAPARPSVREGFPG